MDAMELSGKGKVELDMEKMLVILSIFVLSGKTEMIEPTCVVDRVVQIFNGIINASTKDHDVKVSIYT